MRGGVTVRLTPLHALAVAAVLALAVLYSYWWEEPAAEPRRTLAPTGPRVYDHRDIFREHNITVYEGSKTCIECHRDEVLEVFHSYHYAMASWLEDVEGAGRVLFGGRFAYNDYCGAIFYNGTVPVNWIGLAVLKKPPEGYEHLKGTFIASGCSMCHGVSLGLVPALPGSEPSEEQLHNIDCLVCHSTVYKGGPAGVKDGFRLVVRTGEGFRYVPNPNLSIDELAASIVNPPTKEACLYCHAFSGGGPGFKRPNLDPSLMGEVAREVDVHLASGMSCVDCHPGTGHAFPTRSVDTWSREEGVAPSCVSCHEERHGGVKGWIIEEIHVDKIACQTCHIPYIARGGWPTDVSRDWSRAVFHEEAARYEPVIEFREMVEPVYAWWNEETREVLLYPSEKAVPDENGEVVYVKPVGSRGDGKIYPFKLHKTRVPYDPDAEMLVPVKVGIVFATGNTTAAALAGAKVAGLEFKGDYVTLVRYMQVNHGVAPAEEALGCFDCHGFWETRMDWEELGYGWYPKAAFAAVAAAVVAAAGWAGFKLYRRLAA